MKNELTELLISFKLWLNRLGYAKSTIKGNSRRIEYFLGYLQNEGITKLEDVSPEIINQYQNQVEQLPIKSTTIALYMSSLRLLDQYLESYGYSPIITTKLRITPYVETQKTILNQQEIKQLYRATDQSMQGYKDRAMLAIYYGCGLRASEGLQLGISDVDFKSKLLQVQKSKTYSPRYVPMNPTVCDDLKEYLSYARPLLLKVASTKVLIHGKGYYKEASGFNDRLKQLATLAGITKNITLHGLRHSIATHLLENGMKLEQIRQFLGHSSMQTTQRYTHLMYEENNK